MIRANFTMKLNDLDAGLIEKLKSLFKNDKLIEINVLDDRDETEYLLSTPPASPSSDLSINWNAMTLFQNPPTISRYDHLHPPSFSRHRQTGAVKRPVVRVLVAEDQ